MTEKQYTYLNASKCRSIGSFFCNGIILTNEKVVDLLNENEQLKQRIKSRLHYYRELCNEFDKDDGFNYNIVKRIVEDLEDILK